VTNGRKPEVIKEMPRIFERHFWWFATGVVLLSSVARVFDVNLVQARYNGLCIAQPFCGLWDLADRRNGNGVTS